MGNIYLVRDERQTYMKKIKYKIKHKVDVVSQKLL